MAILRSIVFILIFGSPIFLADLTTEASVAGSMLGIFSRPRAEDIQKPQNNIFLIQRGDLQIQTRVNSEIFAVDIFPPFIYGNVFGRLDFILKGHRLTLQRQLSYEFRSGLAKDQINAFLEEKKVALESILNAFFEKYPEGIYFAWSDFSRFLETFYSRQDATLETRFLEFIRKPDDLKSAVCTDLVALLGKPAAL